MEEEQIHRGYVHPSDREGLRPGEVQTKMFRRHKFQPEKPTNYMAGLPNTQPNDGQPLPIDHTVFDKIEPIEIIPLEITTAKITPKPTVKIGTVGSKKPVESISAIDWTMVNEGRGKTSYTVEQLKDALIKKLGKNPLPSNSKKSDYVAWMRQNKSKLS